MMATLIMLAGLAQQPALSKAADVDDLTRRMMAFDKDGDGKLTKEEITDTRLLRLFNRADADGDGFVTKGELAAIGEAEHSDVPDFDFGPRRPTERHPRGHPLPPRRRPDLES